MHYRRPRSNLVYHHKHRLAPPEGTGRSLAAERCSQPVRLRGQVDYVDRDSGALLRRYATADEPGGVLCVPCKTRLASRCLSCAETYRADVYQLIRAGLTGGKGVPATVAAHPCLFVTFTAPSFGPVHARREKDGQVLPCRPRRDGGTCPHGHPLSCTERHSADDPRTGTPICPECYDYTGSVLFNALAPELWRRFTTGVPRALARLAGMTQKALKAQVSVASAKVAEYQRRGVVHFHAVIRLDGRGGPASLPPGWATAELLAEAVIRAAGAVTLEAPPVIPLRPRVLRWGEQVDIRPIAAGGELTDNAVAGYIAKYATKAAECTGTLDRRIAPDENPDKLPVTPHARRLIAEALRLAQLPCLRQLRTARWAHMLGYRGHFSSKSHAYSTSLGALRAARAEHRSATASQAPGADTVLVIADWQIEGQAQPGRSRRPRNRHHRHHYRRNRAARRRALLQLTAATRLPADPEPATTRRKRHRARRERTLHAARRDDNPGTAS